MKPSPKPSTSFNEISPPYGVLLMKTKGGRPFTLRTDDIKTVGLDSDMDVRVVYKDDTHYIRTNYDVFVQAYFTALTERAILDLRDICSLEDHDPLAHKYIEKHMDDDDMAQLRSRIKRVRVSDFKIA